jgi:fructoselysine-6-P-deglycase FrlB-like protein
MGKPYATEIESLPDTYAWCLKQTVSLLSECIQSQSQFPLLAIGSGGSFTAAAFAAYLHQLTTGQIAKAATPFDAVHSPLNLRNTCILLLTAGGKNPDVLGAFTKLIEREPRSITVLCTRSKSPLSKLAAGWGDEKLALTDLGAWIRDACF